VSRVSYYTEAEKNAYAHGLSDGWAAAAYGDGTESPGTSDWRYAEGNLQYAYIAGWREGTDHFHAGRWADGEPRGE